jgi:hypothetical protein
VAFTSSSQLISLQLGHRQQTAIERKPSQNIHDWTAARIADEKDKRLKEVRAQ